MTPTRARLTNPLPQRVERSHAVRSLVATLLALGIGGALGACSAPADSGPAKPSIARPTAPHPPVFQPQPPAPDMDSPSMSSSSGATTSSTGQTGVPALPSSQFGTTASAPATHAPPKITPPTGTQAGTQPGTQPAASKAAPVVPLDAPLTAADIERHVRTLSSDAMAGRDTGSPEGLVAAAYLQGVLQRSGLRAAGDDGTFLQTTDWRGFHADSVPELATLGADGKPEPSVYGTDFTYQRGPPIDATLDVIVVRSAADVPKSPRADAALLLVGAHRPAQQWLDQAGAPDGRGFGAVLFAAPTPSATPSPPSTDAPHGLFSVGGGGAGGASGASAPGGGPPPTFIVRGALRDRLVDGHVARVRIALRATDIWPADNVVGVLDGAGTPDHPELAQQAIVFSAHYDHLGVAPAPAPAAAGAAAAGAAAGAAGGAAAGDTAPPPDLIYNGADDDASGVAAVLELAEVFGDHAQHGQRPARTLVFMLVTGEERGLLGTTYYLDHPVVPLAQTVCNLNFEMIGRPDPLVGGSGKLWLTGFERSNLGPAWAAAGLAIAPDKRPDEHFFERSDNIAFVQRGIVGQTLSTYNLHTDYHTVRDEADRCDFPHMEACVRAGLAAAQTLADGSLTPQWTPQPPAAQPGATAPAAPTAPGAPGAPAAGAPNAQAPGAPPPR